MSSTRFTSNPYIVGPPILDPANFFGRKEIVRKIFSILNSSHPGSISIIGERRIGKTSLLKYISNDAVRAEHLESAQDYLFVYIDFQVLSARTSDAVFQLLLDNLKKYEPTKINSLAEPFEIFNYIIRNLSQSGKKIIFIFDEFDAIVKLPGEEWRLFGQLRLIALEFPVAYVISSYLPLNQIEQAHGSVSSFSGIFRTIYLGLFSKTEAEELISKLPTSGGLQIQQHEMFVYDLAGYHPYFLQLACYNLVDYFNSVGHLNKMDYPMIRERYLSEADLIFNYLVERLSPEKRSVLFAVEKDRELDAYETQAAQELVDRGYLTITKGKPKLFSATFERFIKDISATTVFHSVISEIEIGLFQSGSIKPSSLERLNSLPAKAAIKRYYDAFTDLELSFDENSGTLSLKDFQKISPVLRAWELANRKFDSPLQFFESVTELHHVLCRALGLPPPDEEGVRHNRLFAFTVDSSRIFENTNLPTRLPLIYLQGDELLSTDIDDIRYLLSNLLGTTVRIAIMILPIDGESLDYARKTLSEKLSKVYAYDIVATGNRDLRLLIAAKSPQQAIKRLLLSQVNLTSISPFIITGPALNRVFFGRENELREITEHISATNYTLIGGRRIGKTSILKRLEYVRLPASGIRALFHDCSFTPTQDELVQAVVSDKSWFPEALLPPPETFARVIQNLPQDKSLVILLDEADKLIESDRNTGYPLFNTLRAMANAGRCRFVLSGEQVLRIELTNPNSPLYNFANEMLIGRLDYQAVDELITRPMKQLEIELEKEAGIVQRIWDFTSGHPNVIQRLCQRLIVRLNQRGSRRLTFEDVEAVVSHPDFLRKDFLNVYWERATALERLCSLLIAANKKVSTLTAVHEGLIARGIPVTLNQTDDALERLVDLRNILQRTKAGYEFAVAAFPEVIAKTARLDDLISLNQETFQSQGDVYPHSEQSGL